MNCRGYKIKYITSLYKPESEWYWEARKGELVFTDKDFKTLLHILAYRP